MLQSLPMINKTAGSEIDNMEEGIPKILIVDLGSQYSQVIARSLRELGYRSAILTDKRAEQWLTLHRPEAIILSGGHASVSDFGAPKPPANVWEQDLPVLGICYGMQYMVQHFGGLVKHKRGHAEYGPASINIDDSDGLFISLDKREKVWASHGDTVQKLPEGFKAIAGSDAYQNAAISNEERKLWGVQFHPEVSHTPNGKKILKNFIAAISNIKEDWEPVDIIKQIQKETRESFSDKKTIIGFSGGVDSTTLTAILAPVLAKNLLAVCIDAGQFRLNELEQIQNTINTIGVQLKIIDAEKELLEKLKGVVDAQKKRSVFREVYKAAFDKSIAEFGAEIIAQGSLATDFIESGAIGGGEVIKTHHNIGLDFVSEERHPFRNLFKYEVRALAKEIDLPDYIANREPFPGPGLILRVVGADVTKERLDIVRFADKTVRDILEKHDLLNAETLSQLVVYMLAGSPVVGVKGDARVYDAPIVVRALKTVDFMTGDGVQLPAEVRLEITLALTKHSHISRVLFDETPKPPATTEPE